MQLTCGISVSLSLLPNLAHRVCVALASVHRFWSVAFTLRTAPRRCSPARSVPLGAALDVSLCFPCQSCDALWCVAFSQLAVPLSRFAQSGCLYAPRYVMGIPSTPQQSSIGGLPSSGVSRTSCRALCRCLLRILLRRDMRHRAVRRGAASSHGSKDSKRLPRCAGMWKAEQRVRRRCGMG